MKTTILLFLLLSSLGNLYSQFTAPGYYITQKNDTIVTQINIQKGVFGQITNDFLKEVEVVDSINGSKRFTPDDIKGYGLSHKGARYNFVSKPVKNGSYKFLTPVIVGSKTSLYQYARYTSGSGSVTSSNLVFYTFEKADGSYLFLQNILNKKFRSQVKDFYKDNAEAQQLIDTKFKYWLDLQKDLKEILYIVNRP